MTLKAKFYLPYDMEGTVMAQASKMVYLGAFYHVVSK
jgi:hypothetical protein